MEISTTTTTSSSLAGSPPSLSGHISPTSPPHDPLATGLRNLFDPTIRTTTEKLWSVHQSQLALSEELNRLISQLSHYLETTDPPALKPTIIKLASVGKRLGVVNTQLHQIQARVNRLFIQLSKQKATTSTATPSAYTSASAGGSIRDGNVGGSSSLVGTSTVNVPGEAGTSASASKAGSGMVDT